jgi:predicted flap endonuclease-1-like 5' DNA nuclease
LAVEAPDAAAEVEAKASEVSADIEAAAAPVVETTAPVPAVIAALAAAKAAASRDVEPVVEAPSVEAVASEPTTEELVARSLAQGVAAEPTVVEAQAPQVEISDLVTSAPVEVDLAAAATAAGLAAVATHARADAERQVAESVVAADSGVAEASEPAVEAEIAEAHETQAEAESVDAEGAVIGAEAAEAAPADEELGELSAQLAALEAEISGQPEAEPVARLPGAEEAARVAAEMAAIKASAPAAPAAEAKERKSAKMTARLAYVEGIGEVYAAKLEEIGIRTPEELLARGATRKGREEIVERTGISSKLVLKWINHTDMYRVSGIGSEYADLLEAAGVDTVVELATRVPANLHARLVAINQEKKLVRQLPVLAQVERWVAAAKLLPRVVTY